MKPNSYVFLLLLTLLSACSGIPRYANDPQSQMADISASRTRIEPKVVERCYQGADGREDCRSESIFIGIAISGGGSRAANYSAAVLSELDSIGLLPHVNAISSVSGGSLTAAYLAQKGSPRRTNPPEFWHQAKVDLSQNFRTEFVKKALRPDNFFATMFGSVGRTELMAEVFDEMIFHGAKFRDLNSTGFSLVMNATAINNIYGMRKIQTCTNRQGNATSIRWESIPFSSDFFNNCLSSTLDSYPISRAVTASAAFPGVYSSVPLGAYVPWNDNDQVPSSPRQYLHLIDGGPSDNLGVEGLIGPLLTKMGELKRPLDRCLIIVIDAFNSGDIDKRYRRDDIRSAKDRIVDFNFMDSVDAMLYRRREDTLRALGIRFPNFDTGGSIYHSAHNFPLPSGYYDYYGIANLSNVNMSNIHGRTPGTIIGSDEISQSLNPTTDSNCLIWYMGLDSLRELAITDWKYFETPKIKSQSLSGDIFYEYPTLEGLPNSEIQESLEEYVQTDRPRRINDAWELATRVSTDFNLVGPPRCSNKVLSEALWIAGKASVNADVRSRRKICKWLDDAKLSRSMKCDSNEKFEVPKLPIQYLPSDIWFEYSVECN